MSNGWFYNQNMLRRYPELLANYPKLDGDTAALGLIKRMGVLPGLHQLPCRDLKRCWRHRNV